MKLCVQFFYNFVKFIRHKKVEEAEENGVDEVTDPHGQRVHHDVHQRHDKS